MHQLHTDKQDGHLLKHIRVLTQRALGMTCCDGSSVLLKPSVLPKPSQSPGAFSQNERGSWRP